MGDSQIIAVSYGLSVALCILMVFGLMRSSRTNGTTLPSFVALTTLSSLAFCMFCLFASLGIRSLQNDSRIIFMLFLLAPLGLGFCLLVSGLAFLVVKAIPRLSRIIVSGVDKKAKTRIISIAVLCTGLVLVCTVFIVG